MRRHQGARLAQQFGLNEPDLLRAQDATLPATLVIAPASMAAATANHISSFWNPGAHGIRSAAPAPQRESQKAAPITGPREGRARSAPRLVSPACSHAFGQTLSDAHELGIAGCEAILADPNVVLHARTHRIRAALQGPFHHLRLMATYASRGPGRAGNDALGFASRMSSRCSSAGSAFWTPITNCTCGLGDIRPASISRFAP